MNNEPTLRSAAETFKWSMENRELTPRENEIFEFVFKQEEQLSAAKREIEELNRQVTLNRENWRMDSEEKETTIRQLKSANESLKNNDGYITDCLGTMSIQREELSKQLSDLRTENETLKAQWKEYCGEYDLMMARWKDEKADIAKRCGFPWDINGVGLEPWCATDDLRKERDALKYALKQAAKALGICEWNLAAVRQMDKHIFETSGKIICGRVQDESVKPALANPFIQSALIEE